MKVLIPFFMLSILMAACSAKHDATPIGKLDDSGVVDTYRNGNIVIGQGVRIVDLGNGPIEFSLDAAGNPQFTQPQPDSIREQVTRIRAQFKELGIISFFSLGNNAAFIFTNYSDSAYADVVKHNENYVDNSVLAEDKENTPYRYVYVYVYPDNNSTVELNRLRRTHTTFKVRDNWYYFRTFDFSGDSEF